MDCFVLTDKPTSITKSKDAKDQKAKSTPLRDTSGLALIGDLLKHQAELTNDRSQLALVLANLKQPDTLEKILKTLLDYPTFGTKA